jgi:hypothetical protein
VDYHYFAHTWTIHILKSREFTELVEYYAKLTGSGNSGKTVRTGYDKKYGKVNVPIWSLYRAVFV